MKPTKTTIKKSFHGWVAKSLFLNVKNSQDVEVTTMKRSRGEIASTFQYGTHKEADGYSSFGYVIFQDKNGVLLRNKKNATQKAIELQHEEAVKLFINSFN